MSAHEFHIEPYKISKFNEPYLYSINRAVFEKNSAKAMFDEFFSQQLKDEDYFYIILGCDSGLLMDYIINDSFAEGSRYLFIDSPHVIENLNAQLSFTSTNEHVVLCTIEQWQEQAQELKLQAYMYTDKVRYLKSIAATDGFFNFYDQANREISMQLEAIQYQTRTSLSRAPFIIKQMLNIADSIHPMVKLKGYFDDQPCIILGGGPSLDDTIDWLKSVNDQVILIAVSRIANRLIDEGIKPHFIISVDPHHVSFDVSKELLEMSEDTIFLHSNHVVPVLLGQWSGLSFYDGSYVPWPSKIQKENIQLTGPTVTNAAIRAATKLGFKQIYLTGVDLCYASNGLTHAKGSNEAKLGPMLGKREQWVKTYNGQQVESSMAYVHASKVIENQAKEAKEVGCKIFNLSENAVAIDNIELIHFSDIKFSASNQPKEIIQTIREHHSIEHDQDLKFVLKEIDKVKKEVVEIKRLVSKALKDNKALYLKYDNEEKNAKIKHRIDQAEKKLSNKYGKISTFLKQFGIHRFIKIAQTDSDREWSDEKMEQIGETYYQAFQDSANEFATYLNLSKEIIELRIMESAEAPNFDKLFSHWEASEQFGRALNWQNSHSEKYAALPDEIKQKFQQLIEKYYQVLNNQDTFHYRRTQSFNSLNGTDRKVIYLFQSKNIEGLSRLVDNLKKLDASNEVTKYLTLASAYLAVTKNDSATAKRLFEQLPSQELSEDELVQLAAIDIQLENYQSAENYLSQLANLTEEFQVKYAKILKLNGNIARAIEVYNDYIKARPNDITVQIELANLYLDTRQIEPAKALFEQVLIIDSSNKEARYYLDHLDQLSSKADS